MLVDKGKIFFGVHQHDFSKKTQVHLENSKSFKEEDYNQLARTLNLNQH